MMVIHTLSGSASRTHMIKKTDPVSVLSQRLSCEAHCKESLTEESLRTS
jgi:hypothetical protein